MSSDSDYVVITGANRGIGLGLAKVYAGRGCKVVGICRNSSPELNAVADQVIDGVDVTDMKSVSLIRERLAGLSISLLINNAGILENERLGDIRYEDILRQFEVNSVAPLKVSEALLPLMAPKAKLALITSRMGSMADNGSGGYYGYRMSKAALNAAGVSLARDLSVNGIAVGIIHPGFVQTDMVNHAGDISTDVSATRISERIDNLTLSNSGTFWHSNGEILPW